MNSTAGKVPGNAAHILHTAHRSCRVTASDTGIGSRIVVIVILILYITYDTTAVLSAVVVVVTVTSLPT